MNGSSGGLKAQNGFILLGLLQFVAAALEKLISLKIIVDKKYM